MNKDIVFAKFIGLELGSELGYDRWNNDWFDNRGILNGQRNEVLLFQTDWNWLMKVVEKIESLEIIDRMGRFNINTKNFDENYTAFITDKDEDFIQCEGETKIDAVYNVCFEFVDNL